MSQTYTPYDWRELYSMALEDFDPARIAEAHKAVRRRAVELRQAGPQETKERHELDAASYFLNLFTLVGVSESTTQLFNPSSEAYGAKLVERNRLKVLVVEKDADVLAAMERVLDDAGYFTLTAANHREASRLLARETFNILVLDEYLPDKDSIDVLVEWRSSRTVPPLVVVTYDRDPSKTDRMRFSLLGTGAFVKKCEPFELVESLRKLTGD